MEYFYSSGLLERFGSYENIMMGYDDGIEYRDLPCGND